MGLARGGYRRKRPGLLRVLHGTFYRSFHEVRQSFSKVGFVVTPVAAEHPALRRLAGLPSVFRRLVVEFPVMLFQTVEIVVRKPPGRYLAA
jgi:hypothetical protein